MNNYKLLQPLAAILETQSITKSAQKCNVTQSAMSKTLGQIREAFHDDILIREGNHYVLTKRGQELREQLPLLLAQVDALYVPKVMDPKTCTRNFSFATSDFGAQAIFPEICRSIEKEAPLVSVECRLWRTRQALDLAKDSLDLVSTLAVAIPENLCGKIMAQDRLAVVFREGHPLSRGSMSLQDYIEARHVLIMGGGDKDSDVDRALARMGMRRNIFARVTFFQAAFEILVRSNALITTPLHIAADFTKRYELQLRPLPLDVEPHHYYLLWHGKHHHDPEHQWFRELCFPILKGQLEETIASGMKLIHTHSD
ncbi:LysR family transcriptional regulator [Sulfidibacter corallicola]|uniref:LysR family transcriptional regulator n=1 Tax=Sulfidibacter corallicola TaxID=2818388 RepID=A0A8A4THP4_SULCO|nr:LysR family transcriptional regulator [Sulfidibacter corallicola]QTD49153.1 LysR family transcriptional regulator [Sulfidibacter corallicola]